MAPVFAYIDPASGVIFIQLIAAGVAGGIVYCRRVIAGTLRKILGKPASDE